MTAKTDPKLERLFFFGRPFSPLYSCLMASRSTLYRKGILKQSKLEVPVISVGNLVLGGTGKTPMVHYIAKFLLQHNRMPAILSRGYRGAGAANINVVSNGSDILLDATSAGDEPRLLAEKLPTIPVITGKERVASGRFAINSFGADVLILDDGFQHLALSRDLNLVLFSARKLLGNGCVLPGGELREPLSALQRADAFFISGVDAVPNREVEEFIGFLNGLYPEKPLFTGSYEPEKILPGILAGNNEAIAIDDARKMMVYGFCGIARPGSFQDSLLKSGFTLTGFQPFEDHQTYSAGIIRSLIETARDSGAQVLITTEKDMVKLRPIFPKNFSLLALPVILHMNSDFDEFLTGQLTDILES